MPIEEYVLYGDMGGLSFIETQDVYTLPRNELRDQ
jgi:hypothetical protein